MLNHLCALPPTDSVGDDAVKKCDNFCGKYECSLNGCIKPYEGLDAIHFAEWISESNMYKDPDGWQVPDIGCVKTTPELYQIYKKKLLTSH